MMHDIRHIANEFFIFQQNSTTAHRAREMILNARLLLSFCWICSRRTAQTSIQLSTKFGAWSSNESTRGKCRTSTIWDTVWLTCGREWNNALLTTPFTSGADVSVHYVQAKGIHFEYSQWLLNLFLFCENLSITFNVNQHNLGQTSAICLQ